MRILVVTQYFWPENFRINDLCVELAKRGHEITVLTGEPNYPDGVIFDDYNITPSAYNQFQGCDIVRVPIIPRGKGSSFQLILNYISFAFSASLIGLFRLRKKKFDVVFVCQLSPATLALPAILYKKLYKIPVVMWVLDLWPESLEAVGIVKSPRLLSLVGKLVFFIYSNCDLILGQSKAFIEGIGRYCEDKSKIHYFPSWSEDIFSNNSVTKIKDISCFEDCFKIVFAGNIGDAQDFPSILKAMEILKLNKINIKLFLIGDGRKLSWVKEQVVQNGLGHHVYLLGRFPIEMMPSFYNSADALLVTLKASKIFSMTIPGKVQSYMAARKPIIAMLDGEGARVLKEAQCGSVSNSGDFNHLAQSIVTMAQLTHNEREELGFNANQFLVKEFDRAELITKLELKLSSLVWF